MCGKCRDINSRFELNSENSNKRLKQIRVLYFVMVSFLVWRPAGLFSPPLLASQAPAPRLPCARLVQERDLHATKSSIRRLKVCDLNHHGCAMAYATVSDMLRRWMDSWTLRVRLLVAVSVVVITLIVIWLL